MKIELEIPDEELEQAITKILSEKLSHDLLNGYYSGYVYRKETKEIVREIIKSDIDNLSERAVQAASKSIENRAVKKLLNQLEEQ